MSLFLKRIAALLMVLMVPASAFCAGTISGKVMTMGDSLLQIPPEPLKDYTVRVLDEDWNEKGAAESGIDGSYVISNLPENVNLIVEVYPPGPDAPYFGEYFDKKENFDAASRVKLGIGETRTIPFNLQKAPNNSVTGKVMDALGNGISVFYGKQLYVTIFSDSRYFEKTVLVKQDGTYSIRFLKEANDYIAGVFIEESDGCTASFYYMSNPPKTSALFSAQAERIPITKTSALSSIHLYIDPSKARKISGVVSAGADLTGYGIYVYAEDMEYQSSWEVSPNGNFLICGAPPSQSLVVTANPPDNSNDYYPQSVKLSTIAGDQTNVNITMQKAYANKISGRVKDTLGNPILNKQVDIYSNSTGYYRGVPTDSNGFYSASGLKLADDYTVRVEHSLDGRTYSFFYLNPLRSVSNDSKAAKLNVGETSDYRDINIIVGYQGGIIEGTVSRSDGTKLIGVVVKAWSDGFNSGGAESTDANGYYRIWDLETPQNDDQKYLVYISSDKYAMQYYNKVSSPGLATKVGVGVKNIDFVLQTGASISGSVKTEAGLKITEGEVSVASKTAGIYYSQPISPEGTYQFINLPPVGDYIASVFAKGYPPHWYNQKSDEQSADKVDLLKGNAVIDFILKKGGIIKGTVFIGDKFHKGPAGIHVTAWSPTKEINKDAFTDANGDYEIVGLDQTVSDYILSVHYQGHPPMYYKDNLDTDPFNDTVFRHDEAGAVAPSAIIPRHFVLPPGVSIKGTITYNGAPIPNIRVEAESIGIDPMNNEFVFGRGETFSTKEVANDGFNYVISGLRPGPIKPGTNEIVPVTYKVSIHPPIDYAQFAIQERDVIITDKDVLNINFELTKKEGRTIAGKISNLPVGEIVWVNAWSESLRSGRGMEVKGTGDYSITSLIPASDYVVDVSSDKYPRIMYNNKMGWVKPDYVDISAASRLDVNFELPDLTSLQYIAGTITFPESSLIGDRVWVEANSFSTGINRGAEVKRIDQNRAVRYKLQGLLKAKDYTVYADSPRYTRMFYDGNFREIDADPVDISIQSRDDVDFTLTEGYSISGKVVDSNNKGLPGIDVHAWSDSSRTGSHTKTTMEGNFRVTGLISASDFIIEAADWKNKLGCFFYHSSGTVRDASSAERLNSELENKGITITISAGASIKGRVNSSDGKALSGIWVSAWSESIKAGNGVFSLNDGSFEIKGLPTGYYDVAAEPEWSSDYVSQKKTGVASGSTDVAFSLSTKKGTFTLSGSVTAAGKGVPRVAVELFPESGSDGLSDRAWTETGADGSYQISRLAAGTYSVFVMPPPASGYAHYSATLTLTGTMTYSIELKTERIIEGKVVTKDGLPISSATVQVYSKSTGFWQEVSTDKNGGFRINQVPNAADFSVTAMKDGYCEVEKSVTLPETGSAVVSFTLWIGGAITGSVKDSTGAAISDVQVEVYSSSLKDQFSFVGTTWTDSTGSYAVKGLRKGDAAGGIVADYIVQLNAFTKYTNEGDPLRYTRQTKTNVKVGDKVDFIATLAPSDNEISGVITNIGSIDGDYAAVDIFNSTTGRFDHHVIPNSQGRFRFIGLDQTTRYYLGFGVYSGKNKTPTRYQWSGVLTAEASVSNQPTQGAQSYLPGATDIQFTFNLNAIQVKKTVITPGTVRNLRIIGMPTAESGLQSRSMTLTRTPSGNVTNSPTVTVTWDGTSEDERYYCLFNREPSYPITKRNCPEPAITTRKSTSSDLSGDYVDYYFHIAIEDDRGRIGDTTTLQFYIDTVSPKNPSVRVVSSGSSQTSGVVSLELGATGATEMYISNTNYGEGGQWEKLTASKQWTLSDTSNSSAIYVQFRDDARNTVNTLTTVSAARSLTHVLEVLQILAGGTGTGEDATGDTRLSTEDAIYMLQEIAEQR